MHTSTNLYLCLCIHTHTCIIINPHTRSHIIIAIICLQRVINNYVYSKENFFVSQFWWSKNYMLFLCVQSWNFSVIHFFLLGLSHYLLLRVWVWSVNVDYILQCNFWAFNTISETWWLAGFVWGRDGKQNFFSFNKIILRELSSFFFENLMPF